MIRVLHQMEMPGNASTEEVRRGAKELFALPESVPTLIAEYRATESPRARWWLLTLAAKTTREDAVGFLAAEAVKPLPEATMTLTTEGHAPGVASSNALNDEFVNRLAAALGIVDSMSTSSSGAQSAIAAVVAQADEAIARTIGVELFSRDLLSSQLAQALSSRGINPQFSRMSPDKVARLLRATPSFLTPPKNGPLPPSR